MDPSFIILKTECCNEDKNSPCRIILQEITEGVPNSPIIKLINPGDVSFDFTISGLKLENLKNYSEFPKIWNEIKDILYKYDLFISCGDGYDAYVLYNTLSRYEICFNQLKYINAKAICRKAVNELSYTFDWLCDKYLFTQVDDQNPIEIINSWSNILISVLKDSQEDSISNFAGNNKIRIGDFSPIGFTNSIIKNSHKPHIIADIDVPVVPDVNNPFCNMSVVFTGKLDRFTKRDEARELVVKIGGDVPETITRNTDYLVVGKQDLRIVGEAGLSGKMKKAQMFKEKGCPIEIISENDFIEMYYSHDNKEKNN